MSLPLFSGCDTGGYTGGVDTIEFHPGFYIYPIYSGTTGLPLSMSTIYTELTDYPCFGGVQLKYSWNEIEVGDGDYSGITTKILPDLVTIGALSSGANRKRVFILFHLRSSDPVSSSAAANVVPDWMVGHADYAGGQWEFSNTTSTTPAAGGKMICLWNTNVQTRLAACIAALGTALRTYTTADSAAQQFNPVEGIALSESSIGGTPMASQPANVTFPSGYTDKYYEGYYRTALALKLYMPHVVVSAFANQSKAACAAMAGDIPFYSGATAVNGLIAEGIALGGPNQLPDDPGLKANSFDGSGNPGAYFYYPLADGVVPRTPSWQKPDYSWTRLDTSLTPSNGTVGHVPTPDEMYQYAKTNLSATHVFPTRTNVSTYWTDFKNYLTSSGVRYIVSGGLDTTRPSAYPVVNTD